MKILIATMLRRVVGGVETYLRAVLPELRRAGHEIGLYADFDETTDAPRIDDLCPDLPFFSTIDSALNWKPSVCYLQGLDTPEDESALASCVPTVHYVHNYTGSCVSVTKCHMRPVAQPCQRRLGPGCLGLYFPRRCGGNNPVTMVKLYRKNRRHQAVFQKVRNVLVASRHMQAELVRNGADPERTAVVPIFPPNACLNGLPPEPKPFTNRLLFAGRIIALKGWRQLVAALPVAEKLLNRRFTLVVVGDGEERLAFESEANRRGLQTEFTGWCSSQRLAVEMQAADLLVIPSIWPEPFGLVGIEAASFGVPAAGFHLGGIPDWLIAGVTGESAPGQRPDSTELAQAIARALSDAAHWQRLRLGAWQHAQQFSAERHLNLLLPLLESAALRT